MSILKKKKTISPITGTVPHVSVAALHSAHSTSKCEEITTFMSKLYFVKAILSLLLMGGLSATYTRTEKVALVTLLSIFSNRLTRCKGHYFQIH